MATGAARTILRERDLSSTITSASGVSAYINIPGAKRGSIDEATHCSSQSDFLRKMTPDRSINIGYNLAHFSALAFLTGSDSLYVSRTTKNAKYGGLLVPDASSNVDFKPVSEGISDPLAFNIPAQYLYLIHAIDPGHWNAGLAIRQVRNTKELATYLPFDIIVMYYGKEVERHTVSRNQSAKNGYGKSMYIETVLRSSQYIRAIDNSGLRVDSEPKYTEATSTTISKPTIIQEFKPAVVGKPQKTAISFLTGNETGKDVNYSFLGETVSIASNSTTASAIVEEIAREFVIPHGLQNVIHELTNTGNTLYIEYKQEAGYQDLPDMIRANSVRTSDWVVDQQYASSKKPRIISFNVINANTSGFPETFTLNGVETEITASATSVSDVAQLIASSIYTGDTKIESVTSKGAKVIVKYKGTEDSVSSFPDKTVPITISCANPHIVQEYEETQSASPQKQQLSVLTGNSKNTPEKLKIGYSDIIIQANSITPELAATDIKNGDFSKTTSVTSVDVIGNTVTFTMTLDSEDSVNPDNNYAVLSIDGGSSVDGIIIQGGSDGEAVTDGDLVQVTQNQSSNLKFTLLLDGGRSTPTYGKALVSIAERRMDCVALLSTPYEAAASSNYVNDLLKYRNNDLNINSSYGALYSPHLLINDNYNDRKIFVSPDGYVAAKISATENTYDLWYPTAGYKRGVINDALDVQRRFNETEQGLLYDAGINPIKFQQGKGIVIWGQKTLQSRPSATDRLNVRLLLIYIEPAIKDALDENFIFELNDVDTRQLAYDLVNNYMRNIKGRKGVYDFKVVCDSSNNTNYDIDNNQMNLDLYVQPSKSLEWIYFTTVITNTGVTVTAG